MFRAFEDMADNQRSKGNQIKCTDGEDRRQGNKGTTPTTKASADGNIQSKKKRPRHRGKGHIEDRVAEIVSRILDDRRAQPSQPITASMASQNNNQPPNPLPHFPYVSHNPGPQWVTQLQVHPSYQQLYYQQPYYQHPPPHLSQAFVHQYTPYTQDFTLYNQCPSQHPSQPSQHPSQPSQHPSQPSQHPSQLSQHPSQPSQHPSQPSQHPNQPSQHPNQPSQHPNQQFLPPNIPQPTNADRVAPFPYQAESQSREHSSESRLQDTKSDDIGCSETEVTKKPGHVALLDHNQALQERGSGQESNKLGASACLSVPIQVPASPPTTKLDQVLHSPSVIPETQFDSITQDYIPNGHPSSHGNAEETDDMIIYHRETLDPSTISHHRKHASVDHLDISPTLHQVEWAYEPNERALGNLMELDHTNEFVYVNDEAINSVIRLIDRDGLPNGVVICSTFWAADILQHITSPIDGRNDLKGVNSNPLLKQNNVILIPYHESLHDGVYLHWKLIAMNKSERKCTIYDSLRSSPRLELTPPDTKFVKTLIDGLTESFGSWNDWKVTYGKCTPQEDQVSCGLFMLGNIEIILCRLFDLPDYLEAIRNMKPLDLRSRYIITIILNEEQGATHMVKSRWDTLGFNEFPHELAKHFRLNMQTNPTAELVLESGFAFDACSVDGNDVYPDKSFGTQERSWSPMLSNADCLPIPSSPFGMSIDQGFRRDWTEPMPKPSYPKRKISPVTESPTKEKKLQLSDIRNGIPIEPSNYGGMNTLSPELESWLRQNPINHMIVYSRSSPGKKQLKPAIVHENAIQAIKDAMQLFSIQIPSEKQHEIYMKRTKVSDAYIPYPGGAVSRKGGGTLFINAMKTAEVGETILLISRGLDGISNNPQAWVHLKMGYSAYKILIAIEESVTTRNRGNEWVVDGNSRWLIFPLYQLILVINGLYSPCEPAKKFATYMMRSFAHRGALAALDTRGRNGNRAEQYKRALVPCRRCPHVDCKFTVCDTLQGIVVMRRHFESKHVPAPRGSECCTVIGCESKVIDLEKHIRRIHCSHMSVDDLGYRKADGGRTIACLECEGVRWFKSQKNYEDHFEYYHSAIWLEKLSKVDSLNEKIEGVWGVCDMDDGFTLVESSQFEREVAAGDGIMMEIDAALQEEQRQSYGSETDDDDDDDDGIETSNDRALYTEPWGFMQAYIKQMPLKSLRVGYRSWR